MKCALGVALNNIPGEKNNRTVKENKSIRVTVVSTTSYAVDF